MKTKFFPNWLRLTTVLILFLAALAPAGAAQAFGFQPNTALVLTDLGSQLGDFNSGAYGINASGQVIGTYETSDGEEHAYLWLPAPAYGHEAGMIDLGPVETSWPMVLNDSGQLAGVATDGRPFIWLPQAAYGLEAGMNDLEPLPEGFVLAIPNAINASGQVVGEIGWDDVDGNYHLQPFIWLPASAYDLPAGLNILGDSWSWAFDINDAGQVLVSDDAGHAFVWQNGVMTDLGALGGGITEANAINASGQVVGMSRTSGDEYHAFIWQDNLMTDLGVRLGYLHSQASDINDTGQVVGFGSYADDLNHYVFLWDPATETKHELGTLTTDIVPFGPLIFSASGHVALSVIDIFSGTAHGLVGNAATGLLDVGTLGGSRIFLGAINDLGQVAGQSSLEGDEVYHAILVELSGANTAPTADAGGPYLGAINTDIAFDGRDSSDPENDALTYAWTFGDGGSGSDVMPIHSYTATGIYNVCLTVNDGELNSDEDCTIAVVYDPSGGFVTGGGWIMSPSGAYVDDTSLSGKATFGFVSKYHKGASVPSGTTAFAFDLAGLSFYSDSYEWLVVNQGGSNAQFKGVGSINGSGTYKFMLWAGDGSPDTFRIKIWWEDEDGEHVVYDNGFAGSGYETGQPIGAGNIVVHKGK